MQQIIMKLMTQYNEKSFELKIKSADNRILKEQLQIECFENEELHVNVTLLEQQLTSLSDNKLSSFAHEISKEHADELWKKILSQEIESNVQLLEENSGLCFQNQKPTEEASYVKELTSIDVVEFKILVVMGCDWPLVEGVPEVAPIEGVPEAGPVPWLAEAASE
ncbi:hypothetical protein J1N35_043490 [Gossypium stocksii]|uniref:Uncharacterized protein n=1 Tax=Gossypium stocksii TaxID=47602 RepID=A0A9D3U7D5_9ROSI|nr:hypothetical protein J1N35_043490 [Gossypium stocksii]